LLPAREQPQAALAGCDARACRQFEIPAEGGVVRDASGQVAVDIVGPCQRARFVRG
jgi:hypothetical protein